MREDRIDFIRFIGLSMVIFAHVSPPKLLFQLRNFDVPLLVMVSGMSFQLSYKGGAYKTYVWKRIKRLIFPTWFFLTCYFLTLLILDFNVADLNISKVATSYLLLHGIGYVWIIRVFFLVALVSPLIFSLDKRLKGDISYLTILIALFGVYEVCRYSLMPYMESVFLNFLSQQLFYLLPYSLIFAFGVRISKLTATTKIMLCMNVFAIFVGAALFLNFQKGHFVSTQYYKYPPSTYYVSYALLVSIFIDLTSQKLWAIIKERKQIKNIILFVAQNTIWIYLLHIPFVKFLQMNFIFKYVVVFSSSAALVWLQVKAVNSCLLPRIPNKKVRNNIRTLLTGQIF